jgi:hypothetical protein
MTDDAYLFLVEDPAEPLGVPPAAVGELTCMETASVRAWLDAQGIAATSPHVRVVPLEGTDAIPENAERLSVPLSDEELSRLRHRTPPSPRWWPGPVSGPETAVRITRGGPSGDGRTSLEPGGSGRGTTSRQRTYPRTP